MDFVKSSIVDGSIDQVGVVVRDACQVAEQLTALLGAGPFRLMEYPIPGVDAQAMFRGEPAVYRVLLAFGQLGPTQIELVQPLEGQSIWGEFLERHGPGLHHFRVTVSNFDETVQAWQAAGIENVASGTGAHVGSRWAYFDTSALLDGIVIELRKRMDESAGEGQWATDGIQLGTEPQPRDG